jgi:acyl-CoA reductase-like NAD-dependent aldehyde dehydrogenase
MTTRTHQTARTAGWDECVELLQRALPRWRATHLAERVALLRELRRRIGQEAAGIAAATREAQSLGSSGPWAAESWAPAFCAAQTARTLERTLRLLESGRNPVAGRSIRTRPDGQVVVDVFPATWDDRMLFQGCRGQVWLTPGTTPEQVLAATANAHRTRDHDDAGVALLLAAGNVLNLVITDLIDLLFGRDCVVVVKMNPVLRYQRPAVERIFAEFVEAGYVAFVDEDLDAGTYFAGHPGIDLIHITGSARTHDAIVWGTDDQVQVRRRDGTPLIDKPVTAELGGVGPFIVVPGDWADRDIRRQADLIVYAKLFNSGHICAAPQILVLPDGWPTADRLLAEVRRLMRTAPARPRYYPGSDEKVLAVLDEHADAEPCCGERDRVIVDRLDPTQDSLLLTQEVFADVLGVVRLPAASIDDYLDTAVTFANERLAGTLAASVLVDPAAAKQRAPAIDRAIADLRYGTIGVNEWAVMGYNLGYTTWGAYPGHTREAIGSGTGVVLNPYQLPEPQKSVITAPFRPRLKPASSVTHRSSDRLMPAAVRYLTTDNRRLLPGLIATALQG